MLRHYSLRHLFGQDGRNYTDSINLSFYGNMGFEIGDLYVDRGPDQGHYLTMDFGIGVGTPEASSTSEFMKLYYSGPASNITAETFYGPRVEGSLGAGYYGVGAGVNVSYAWDVDNDPKNRFVLGLGWNAGLTTPKIGGNVNYGVTVPAGSRLMKAFFESLNW